VHRVTIEVRICHIVLIGRLLAWAIAGIRHGHATQLRCGQQLYNNKGNSAERLHDCVHPGYCNNA
jgi:hypothetical protein